MTSEEPPKEEDIYRDTPVRLLGYANEVGEAFRYQIPSLVGPSYAVSSGYVLADTWDKFSKDETDGKYVTALDTVVWQGLASVAVPGFTIHTIVRSCKAVIPKGAPPFAHAWIPTFCGLGAIPFIVEPIDELVTMTMDSFSPTRSGKK
mmetsp:Transcript_23263/g.72723  ORF Transcript_23263/g.72723 Transcript_23263/m.72723 type:complete len:148 (-) Transcript_23263:86-529(-)